MKSDRSNATRGMVARGQFQKLNLEKWTSSRPLSALLLVERLKSLHLLKSLHFAPTHGFLGDRYGMGCQGPRHYSLPWTVVRQRKSH